MANIKIEILFKIYFLKFSNKNVLFKKKRLYKDFISSAKFYLSLKMFKSLIKKN